MGSEVTYRWIYVWKGNVSFTINSKQSLCSVTDINHHDIIKVGVYSILSRVGNCSAVQFTFGNVAIEFRAPRSDEMNDQLYKCVIFKPLKLGWKTRVCEPVWLILHGTTWPHRFLNSKWSSSRPKMTLSQMCPDVSARIFTPLTALASASEVEHPSRVNSKGSSRCQSLRHGGGNKNNCARRLCGEATPSSPGFTATRSQAEFCLFTIF